jgi:imidazole glycerol-phosphate synthase subunit HisH
MRSGRIAVADYGIGNLGSAMNALAHSGADAKLTASAADIAAADAVVLPGVGAFGACMQALDASGLRDAVVDAASSGRPFLGICVGMQMLFDGSEEDDSVTGLGVIPGIVRRLGTGLPRPQMQWNRLHLLAPSDPLFEGLGDAPWMYFVHSLHGVPADPRAVIATCEYDGPVNAVFRLGNVWATQFHPEKSSASGLALLRNFARLASRVPA